MHRPKCDIRYAIVRVTDLEIPAMQWIRMVDWDCRARSVCVCVCVCVCLRVCACMRVKSTCMQCENQEWVKEHETLYTMYTKGIRHSALYSVVSSNQFFKASN